MFIEGGIEITTMTTSRVGGIKISLISSTTIIVKFPIRLNRTADVKRSEIRATTKALRSSVVFRCFEFHFLWVLNIIDGFIGWGIEIIHSPAFYRPHIPINPK